jgi:hypothetical protein
MEILVHAFFVAEIFKNGTFPIFSLSTRLPRRLWVDLYENITDSIRADSKVKFRVEVGKL